MLKDSRSSVIRKKFIDFFVQKGHEFYKSASLIPNNDKSLLWINSGIAALKKEFSSPNNRKKIVNCQKCVRTNDIENVGITSRHHTFFEMLGNFSISEYFRKEAIDLAWEFLTSKDWLDINPKKLYVTVFPDDKETYEYWKTKIPAKNIFLCKENFWEIGEGPCGPCTEIFYDRGSSYNNPKNTIEEYPGGDNERYIEIWNIVFSQYYSQKHLKRQQYSELPNKNIDTGMGLERICCILQNAEDNFSTDLFLPIIKKLEKISNKKYTKENKGDYLSFRIISDHIRALIFMISDGALPSNVSNGYVIKRLLRRAVLEGIKLGIEDAFLHTMVKVVAETATDFYKLENISSVEKTILYEEKKFFTTIREGIKKLNSLIEPIKTTVGKIKKASNTNMSEFFNNRSRIPQPILEGYEAFKLYDTYGLPLEITKMLAAKFNVVVDEERFNECMKLQVKRSKKDNLLKKKDYIFYSNDNFIDEALLENIHDTSFIGYECLSLKSQSPILILNERNEKVSCLREGEKGIIIFNKTPFYPEGGGQESDVGELINNKNKICVNKVTKYLNIILHHVYVHKGSITSKIKFDLIVNKERRFLHSCAHTATHLLNLTLKKILSCDIRQAGSRISTDKLSFDFTYGHPLDKKELILIEDTINSYISENILVSYINTSLEEAKKSQAVGIFYERYKRLDSVRVVTIGESKELCGGTHVKNTSEIGIFKILTQKNVSSGIRRIEAVVNKDAIKFVMKRSRILDDIKNNFKIKNDTLISEYINKKNREFISMEKQNEQMSTKFLSVLFKNYLTKSIESISYKAIVIDFKVNTGIIKKALLNISKKFEDVDILIIYIKDEGAEHNLIMIHSSSVDMRKISKNIKLLSNIKGGGNKQFAQLQVDVSIEIDNFLVLLHKAIKE